MEEQTISEMLVEEIKAQIEDLSALETGSAEKSKAIEDLAKLYRVRIDEAKVDWEADEKYYRRQMDERQKESELTFKQEQQKLDEAFRVSQLETEHGIKAAQLAEAKKDRYFKLGIGVAELLIPLGFYAAWMRKGFKFEETGSFTSQTFRGLWNRFRPTKK